MLQKLKLSAESYGPVEIKAGFTICQVALIIRLYSFTLIWAKRGTVRVNYLSHERNRIIPAGLLIFNV